MFAKSLLLLLFAAILASLGAALYALLRDHAPSERTVRLLTWRTLLSITLFLLLLAAFAGGLITPHAPPFVATTHHQ